MRSHAEYQAMDAAHHLHPFTDFKALQEHGTRVITHAQVDELMLKAREALDCTLADLYH